jgi:hypothetical protein
MTGYTGMGGLSIENFGAIVDPQPDKGEEYAHAANSDNDRTCPDAASNSNIGGNNDIESGSSESQHTAITEAVVEDIAELEDTGGKDDHGVDNG